MPRDFLYEARVIEDINLPFTFHYNMATGKSYHGPAAQICVPNWHENIEILYFDYGEGFVRCGADEIEVKAGDIAIINSNKIHCVYSDLCLKYYCLIPDIDFFVSNGIDIVSFVFESKITDSEANKKFEYIAECYKKTDAFAVASIRSSILDFLVYICSRYTFSPPVAQYEKSNDAIRAAIEYIDSNISQKLTLESIASIVGLSKYHFAREFKKTTGSTVFSYINLKRCDLATALLGRQNYTVAEVSERCGFENFSYFSKIFKQYTGLPPHKFKKEKNKGG